MDFRLGPPGQVAAVAGKKAGMKQGELGGILKELGYSEDQVSFVPNHFLLPPNNSFVSGLQILAKAIHLDSTCAFGWIHC